MKKENIVVDYLPVTDIKPYAKNAKKHPEQQINYIANSLQKFGFKQPIVIDKNNVVVAGHGRLLAAKKLGIDKVPCIFADDLTDEEIKAFRLADNKTNESEWDFELLDLELDELKLDDIDMSDFGFDTEPVFEELEGGEVEDKTKDKVSIRLVFDNVSKWRQYEKEVREFVDKIEGITVSVGELKDEDK